MGHICSLKFPSILIKKVKKKVQSSETVEKNNSNIYGLYLEIREELPTELHIYLLL